MTLKLLATGVAAAAVIGGAAAGVTSVASSTPVASPAVQPVVFGAPLPQTPAPELQSQLVATLDALQSGGSFSGAKASYIEGGLGRIEGITGFWKAAEICVAHRRQANAHNFSTAIVSAASQALSFASRTGGASSPSSAKSSALRAKR